MTVIDEITLHPLSGTTVEARQRLLVFFVTGNPGLIAYYADFIKAIQAKLAAQDGQDRDIIFYGSSLDGFEINKSPDPAIRLPLSLREQISRVRQRVEAKVAELGGGGTTSQQEPMPVVLIGHSVGSYILMEVIAQWQQEQRQRRQASSYRPVAGICLFPTVTEIAKSSKGQQLSWLLGLPYISIILQLVARLFLLIPRIPYLDWAEAFNPGQLCVEVTEAMIKSRHGVRQLLYMASDEMKLIREDKWLPELWGVTATHTGAATATLPQSDAHKLKLYFYWGADDYWVDNKIRDALIKQRGSREGDEETRDWPHMQIASNSNIEHCFSLNPEHMQIVATEVAGYLGQIKQRVGLTGKKLMNTKST